MPDDRWVSAGRNRRVHRRDLQARRGNRKGPLARAERIDQATPAHVRGTFTLTSKITRSPPRNSGLRQRVIGSSAAFSPFVMLHGWLNTIRLAERVCLYQAQRLGSRGREYALPSVASQAACHDSRASLGYLAGMNQSLTVAVPP